MPKKKPATTKVSSLNWITIDHLVEVLELKRRKLSGIRANAKQHDPNLPRVPYKVEQIPLPVDSPRVIAHFREFYKDPPEILGKLTLARPDFGKRSGPKTKKAKFSQMTATWLFLSASVTKRY